MSGSSPSQLIRTTRCITCTYIDILHVMHIKSVKEKAFSALQPTYEHTVRPWRELHLISSFSWGCLLWDQRDESSWSSFSITGPPKANSLYIPPTRWSFQYWNTFMSLERQEDKARCNVSIHCLSQTSADTQPQVFANWKFHSTFSWCKFSHGQFGNGKRNISIDLTTSSCLIFDAQVTNPVSSYKSCTTSSLASKKRLEEPRNSNGLTLCCAVSLLSPSSRPSINKLLTLQMAITIKPASIGP